MTLIDANQALTQSIAEHCVQGLGRKHLEELTVVLNNNDLTCRVVVALRQNNDREQTRALEKLFEVQALFFEDAAMSFDFGHEAEVPSQLGTSKRQYSFA